MTDIYLEIGKKKVIACSLRWPGWCRFGKTEETAMQALIDSAPRYKKIAERAESAFDYDDLVVVERLPGDTTTDFGAPSQIPIADRKPISAAEANHGVKLLQASWSIMDDVIATSSASLRKGPRGGGRERDAVAKHVIEAERAYASKIGIRHKPFTLQDHTALTSMRTEIATALNNPSNGSPLVPGGWPTAYILRRMAWHVIDHIWEIEDRQI